MAPELRAPKGARKKKRIAGRGNSSGNGTTAGRGTKGQNARSGGGVREGFEGGQMPLYRRIARRGFSNHPFKIEYVTVNVEELQAAFKSGEKVNEASLKERGLVGAKAKHIKLLGNGEVKKKLNVSGIKLSANAARKIEAAGGTVEAVTGTKGADSGGAPAKGRAAGESTAKAEESTEEKESGSESTES